jgi:hypothetical protein
MSLQTQRKLLHIHIRSFNYNGRIVLNTLSYGRESDILVDLSNWLNQRSFITTCCKPVGSFPYLNLVGPKFKSRPRVWLAWGFSWFSSTIPPFFARHFQFLFTNNLAIVYYQVRTTDDVIKTLDTIKLLWCSIRFWWHNVPTKHYVLSTGSNCLSRCICQQ